MVRILLVEDEPALQMGIHDILSLEGYEVIAKDNGQQAVDYLEACGDDLPALILSDLSMPHLDGAGLLQRVRGREKWRKIAFILMTGKGSLADIERMPNLQVDDILMKPFEADDMMAMISAAVRGAI